MKLLHGKLGPQFDALLFDNDGTLVSSMESVHRCWTRWAREYGITEEDFAAVELHGRPAAEIIADLLPEDVRAGALARIEVLETEDVAGGVVLLPGTKELLSALPAGRWAVVTSATRPLAEARLREVGIDFAELVAADDITRGKPDPEPFLLAAARLGVDPARCAVFEDAPAGLAAGRAAGMTTVALTTTHQAAELDADVVVRDLSAVSVLVGADGVRIETDDRP
ncbi:HAD-IA family hydrolase [Streptomyces sp. NBC_00193]|uniref:HAD-IA family hydrolase n=1 Tax=unclassified Streptomyces TaxID=2593676 RepID=UPI00224E9571|nr:MULTISPECIES: HAD-IA family hydrolase [unclassified Streptomyces]MCX5128966.1 HAD-IA family hydrolase [Streptomyces sp. NBC_00347]MCX5299504.1 HAD-IA family hydrolase [Streptomyces sp. NBC_00193]